MDYLDKKTVNKRNATIAIILCLSSFFLVLWNIADAFLYMKDSFLFPFFQPDLSWIVNLCIAVLLFAIMLLIGKSLAFIPVSQQQNKSFMRRIIQWVGLFGTSLLFLVVGMILTLQMSFKCIGKTTDLDDYLIFDSAVNQQDVLEVFPSAEAVDSYVETGADVSYEYTLESGILDSESTYVIMLEVKGIDAERYQAIKATLMQTYQGLYNDANGELLITIENDARTDLDGYVFSVVRSIECDDATFSITYLVMKDYN